MLPYVIAAGSFAYGVVFPEGRQVKVEAPVQAVVPANSSRGSVAPIFFYGMLFGIGISREIYRRRITDKVRLALYSWLYDTPEAKADVPQKRYRDPVQLQELEGTPMPGSARDDNAGILKELLSPDWSLTPNLRIALLTLPFGAELAAKKADGVEFYYVIEGDGTYCKTSEGEAAKAKRILGGNGFIVDPGTVRSFAANGRGQLVLLRATDSPVVEGYDVVTNDISGKKAITNAGLAKIDEMIKKYSNKTDDFEVLKP